MGLFHATWLELPHQTCYLRQAWTARKFSLTWKGVLCRELVQLSMKETNVSSLLHHPTLASSAWWKDGYSNSMQQTKTLDHSIGRRESFLWFKETSRSPFVITCCPALGAQRCHPFLSQPLACGGKFSGQSGRKTGSDAGEVSVGPLPPQRAEGRPVCLGPGQQPLARSRVPHICVSHDSGEPPPSEPERGPPQIQS